MKRLAILTAFVFGCWAGPALAADLSFTKFHSDITVNADASITVEETITADFGTERHGIFRTIPYRFATLDGKQASIPISILSVTQDGQQAKYSISTDGTNVTAKIGDPNATISGSHEYVITYKTQAAVNFFSDHDELYWNVTGDQWDAPITHISATVHFASDVHGPNGAGPTMTQMACYTGSTGSTAKNCQSSHDASTASFSSDEFLTIVAGWPTGLVTKPANFDQLRQQGTSSASATNKPNLLRGWGLVANILLPLITFGLVFKRWREHGRDPGQHRAIIAQYDPPDNLRPAELSAVMFEKTSTKALPATLVDLAVRGYLKIIEEEKSTMLGLSHKVEYTLRSLKVPGTALREYERDLLTTLFAEHLFPAGDSDLKLSELKKRKYTSDPFAPIFRQVVDEVTSGGYFVSNPTTTRTLWAFLGVGVGGIGTFLSISGYALYGLIAAGVIIIAFAAAMPQRTAKGVEAAWIGHGFKLFLETAEKYRLQWQERKNIFEQFLPYAMIFGIADTWSTALKDVATVSPTWYQGQPGTAFNTMVFWGAMSSFGTSVRSSVVSAAASGSSGFGGGGFSGGGGGGGGGGGW